MKFVRICLSLIGVAGFTLLAQVPPAENLLPDDTIGLVTIPDWKKLAASSAQSSWGQLWADPAMKPFHDNFTSNFVTDFIKPLEKQTGLKFSDYKELLQGQITFALTPPRAGSKEFAAFLLLLDAKDKSELLTSKLNELKKKWTEAGKEVKTEKIRDVEFSSIAVSGADVDSLLKKAFPSGDEDKDDDKKPAESTQLRFGQFKSLLIIGENEKAIEKLLARQSGGLVPPLAERASYQKSHSMLFRDSVAHAWVNVKPIYDKALQLAAVEQQDPQPGAMPGMKLDKILPALGFNSVETLAGKIASTPDGTSYELMLGAPEAQREGLLKLFTLEKKDSAPPAFVPADVLKFQRTRINAQKAWTTVEATLGKIDPSLAGMVQLMLSSVGKDQDPNFDLKKNLVANLGDDFIQYQKPPKGTKPAELEAAPSLTLIGSPNPAQLLDAVRMLTALLPPPLSSAPLKEREFLGKKIYSLSMGAATPTGAKDPDAKDAPPAQKLSFTASNGYVAFSADDGILEEYLRSAENPPKPLRAAPGLSDAAQRIGGMENGLFSYENQAESLRITMEALKNDPEGFNRTLFSNLSHGDEEGQGIFRRLVNLKLLPSFDQIKKYFGIAVVSGATTADGYVIKAITTQSKSN